ncbi:MAG: hypothetical protein ACJ8BW_39635 [Ktedonobacteraceae bacterium]
MVVPISTLGAIRVRPLLECVGTHREANTDDRVTRLEDPSAPVLWRRGGQPGLHSVVDKGVVRPLGDLMAERVDVLQRPVGAAVWPRVDTRLDPRGPRERLHLGIAIAVVASASEARRACAVEADHTAVEDVFPDMKQDVVRQVNWQMRRISSRLQVLDLRGPPADVDIGEDHSSSTLQQHALVAGNVDRHCWQDVRVQDHVVVARTGLVELRPHCRVLELELVARVALREGATRAPDQSGRIRKRTSRSRGGRRAIVVEGELRRRQRRIEHVAAAERESADVHNHWRDVRLDCHRAVRGAVVRVCTDHVVTVSDAVVRVRRLPEPVRDGASSWQWRRPA